MFNLKGYKTILPLILHCVSLKIKTKYQTIDDTLRIKVLVPRHVENQYR